MQDCHGDTYRSTPTSTTSTSPAIRTTAAMWRDSRRPIADLDLPAWHRIHRRRPRRDQPRPARLLQFRGPATAGAARLVPDINAGSYTGQTQGPWSIPATTTTSCTGVSSPRSTAAISRDWCGSPGRTWPPTTTAPAERGELHPDRDQLRPGHPNQWLSNHDRDNERLTYR